MHYFVYAFVFFLTQLMNADESSLEPVLDLDTMCADFVLETKQIHLPGYPGSFNPSIINVQNGYLFSFRIRDPILSTTNKMGLVFLDKEFNISSKIYVVKMPDRSGFYFSQEQDPRIVQLQDKLYFVFNNVLAKKKIQTSSSLALHEIRRMVIAELCFQNDEFTLKDLQWLLDFETEHEDKTEKNWVPFIYEDQLLLAYTIYPHRIFKPLLGTCSCQPFAFSKAPAQWNWGGLRGGTQALEVDGKYLAFFHTCKDLVTVQSEAKRVVHYFMGAYTFSSRPPFQILAMSPQPIVGPDFYISPSYKTWKPLKVVFPGGFVLDGQYIYVVYGKQDHEAWVVKIDKERLMKSLAVIPYP